jgi:hypothetical protein
MWMTEGWIGDGSMGVSTRSGRSIPDERGASAGGGTVAVMRTYLDPGPDLMLAGNRVRSSTKVAGVGAYHLALATVLPDRGVELHSFYTGHDRLGETSVTHLLLAPGGRELRTEPCLHSEIPVMWARRRCLYDHLQRLADWLRELGHEGVRIDLDDDALPAVDA